MAYLFWKLLHIIAVVIFLGNIMAGIFWATNANRTRKPVLIAHVFAGIIRSDRLFTMPAVSFILIAGVAASIAGNFPILATGWIFWSIVLFSISGLIFGIWVVPLQKKIFQMMEGQDHCSHESWLRYDNLYRAWKFWGLLALITPVLALVIMVLKPDLPGL